MAVLFVLTMMNIITMAAENIQLKPKLVIISIIFTVTLFCGQVTLKKIQKIFLLKFIKGCRKHIEPHQLKLYEVLLSLSRGVPSREKLTDIKERASMNLTKACQIIQTNMLSSEIRILLTGSTAERFNIPLSPYWINMDGIHHKDFHALITDFDFMVFPETKIDKISSKFYLDLSSEELETGYCHVINRETNVIMSAKKVMADIRKLILPMKISDFVEYGPERKVCFCTVWAECNACYVINRGPAISIRLGSQNNSICDKFHGEIAFSFKCCDWPLEISDWAQRPKRKWPSHYDVIRITKGGYHVVPKSQKNDRQGMTWRLSFSKAEVELSQLVPTQARLCLIGLKVILKDYLSIACTRIKSYHLKTIFLYTLENTDPSQWQDASKLETCFLLLLNNLKECITKRHCPHYWISKINLFQDFKIRDVNKLLNVIKKIEMKPENYIEILPIQMESKAPVNNHDLEEVVIVN